MQLLTDRKMLKKKNLNELLDYLIYNEVELIENSLKEWLKDESNDLRNYKEKISGIGSFCSGIVYKADKEYRLAGFIIKKERLIIEDNQQNKSIEYIFIPIFYEGIVDYVNDPIVFQGCANLYDDHGFVSDTLGNSIHLDQILIDKVNVDKFIARTKYDLNKGIKSKGLYWNV